MDKRGEDKCLDTGSQAHQAVFTLCDPQRLEWGLGKKSMLAFVGWRISQVSVWALDSGGRERKEGKS